MKLEISDPVYVPVSNPSGFEKIIFEMISDKRDLPFIKLMLLILFTVIPMALVLYLVQDLKWWMGLAYLVWVMGYLFGPFFLMLHNTSHRPLFRAKFSGLRHLIPWLLGPFFGQTPETYFGHHIGMHHVERNLSKDLSSTMHYQRDGVLDFLHYVGSFYLVGFPSLVKYFFKQKRTKLFRNILIGELCFYALVAGLCFVNLEATFCVFILPFFVARFGMMAGNWAQHAFVDAQDPDNVFLNSISCINSVYNRRCFNDGYHIGHHLKASRHWTEMPQEFAQNIELYAKEKAIVFEGIDYFGVWLLLMTKSYGRLASHFVQLSDSPLSREQIISRLRNRTAKIPVAVPLAV